MTRPSAAERLVERLSHLQDGCRALDAQCDRTAERGGGELVVHLHITPSGDIMAMELVTRFERRAS